MKLSNIKQYAINWLFINNKSPSEIAKELKISEDSINKYLEKHNVQINDSLAVKSRPVKVQTSSKDLMIRHTRDKKSNNVSIMTKEASQMNDSLKISVQNKNTKNQDCIFRPNG